MYEYLAPVNVSVKSQTQDVMNVYHFKSGRREKKDKEEIRWCKEARCSAQALNKVLLKER